MVDSPTSIPGRSESDFRILLERPINSNCLHNTPGTAEVLGSLQQITSTLHRSTWYWLGCCGSCLSHPPPQFLHKINLWPRDFVYFNWSSQSCNRCLMHTLESQFWRGNLKRGAWHFKKVRIWQGILTLPVQKPYSASYGFLSHFLLVLTDLQVCCWVERMMNEAEIVLRQAWTIGRPRGSPAQYYTLLCWGTLHPIL